MRNFLYVFMLIPLCTISLTACIPHETTAKKIIIVFRYDDYSANSPTELDQKVIHAFHSVDASFTIGVIPMAYSHDRDASPENLSGLSEEKINTLKYAHKLNIADIALHGYSHRATSTGQPSEFTGVEYDRQIRILSEGKAILKNNVGCNVDIFIPPWNQYDRNTLYAMEKTGFSMLSANRSGVVKSDDAALKYLPGTCELDELESCLTLAQMSTEKMPIIVVIFHAFNFLDNDEKRGSINYAEFYNRLRDLKNQGNIYLLSLTEASKAVDDLSAERYLLNKRINAIYKYMPISKMRLNGFYVSDDKYYYYAWLAVGLYVLFLLTASMSIMYCAGSKVFSKSKSAMMAGRYGMPALTMILILYAMRDLKLSALGLNVITLTAGATIGAWLSMLRLRRKGK